MVDDDTAPVITLTGPEEGACVSGTTAVVYSASDERLALVEATLDGVPYNSGEPITGDGSHELLITAVDACGLTSEASRSFLIDTLAPSLDLSGVEEGGIYAGQVSVSWVTGDLNLTEVVATLDGGTIDSPYTVAETGAHALVVSAADQTGSIPENREPILATHHVGSQTRVSPNVRSCSPPGGKGKQRGGAYVDSGNRRSRSACWVACPCSAATRHG